jgi:hypothetical protein
MISPNIPVLWPISWMVLSFGGTVAAADGAFGHTGPVLTGILPTEAILVDSSKSVSVL